MAEQATEHALVRRLIEHPRDPAVLGAVYRATFADPRRYAELLSAAAAETADELAGSHWLAEAASVRLEALGETLAAMALLEEALDRDPLNDRAARLLESVLRRGGELQRVARFLKAHVARVEQHLGVDPNLAEAASDTYERLGLLLADTLADHEGAVVALRRALELKRFARDTPRKSAPPDSAWHWRGSQANDDAPDDEDMRDTLVSPIPVQLVSEVPRVPRTEPSPPPSASALPDLIAADASEDRLMGLFEALHTIRSCDTVFEASALVLQIARDAIRCTGGMVHLFDATRGDFVVVAAAGSHHETLLRGRTPGTDPVLRAAHDRLDTLVVGSQDPRLVGGRFQVIRPHNAVACTPVQQDAQWLGAIELVDPVGRETFASPDRHAMTYVGERFADCLIERDLTLD